MANHLGHHALIIGGSMAGLMTARVLADYFAHVTVLERDPIADRPDLHKSIPQGHHYHALLVGGQRVLSALYPGFTEKLNRLGAVRYRVGRDLAYFLPDGKAYTLAGTVREPRDLGLEAYSQSRGLLEYCVRHCTLAVPNIQLETASTVQELMAEKARVRGVRYNGPRGPQSLTADLVVDAGGRGSHTPRWLTELGFHAPEETTIGVDFAYASTKFRIPDSYDEPERLLGFFGPAPQFPNGAYLGAIEDNTWHLSLAGRFGEYPPTDEAGFLAFAKSLHTPKLYTLIKEAERVADIVQYRFPTSVHRHYERLTAFPERFLVLGDALCSFNPIYGQGMSAAALQVQALQQILTERAAGADGLEGLALAFFPKAAEVIATPWTFAANFDLAYPQTRGDRSSQTKESAQYFTALGALVADDAEVQRVVTEVIHLAKPLSALMEEPLRGRVVAQHQKHGRAGKQSHDG